MMSSVSPLQPIGKLVNSGSSGSFYGLGPSSCVEEIGSPTANCIGVNLSSPSTISTNPVANLINCHTLSPSQSDSTTVADNTNSNPFKPNLEGLLKVNTPFSWKREKINDQIVYISPSNCILWSLQEISAYLLTEGTCKCGLECPIILNELFNFDPQIPSISSPPIANKNVNNDPIKDSCYNNNNNSTNIEYLPKTCNHRRRALASRSGDSSCSHISHDTHNQTSFRLNHLSSPIPEITNQSLHHHHQQQHHVHSPALHQQPLTVNPIPTVYRGTHQQSIINHGVTLYKSDGNFNPPEEKQSSYTITRDPSRTSNIPKNFQHPHVSPSLTANTYINWLPLNATDDNRLSAIVNESQSNVQTFANTPSSSLQGFTDVISGMGLTQTLLDPNSQGGGQLVQLYNPVQYTSVPPTTVTLLQPAQNLNRDGPTILIPQLLQHDQQSVVLNSTNNVPSLDQRSILSPIRTSFSSIPLQTSYSFQSQPTESYSTSTSPKQSFVTPNINNKNKNKNKNNNNNNNSNSRVKVKSKLSSYCKTRASRRRLAKIVSNPYSKNHESIERFANHDNDDEESSGSKLGSFNGELNDGHMDSQDIDYENNQFIFNSYNDKSNFDCEKIDGGSQCTSEDIIRELSSHENSAIRNVGVQSDELLHDPESPIGLLESSCSDTNCTSNQIMTKGLEDDSCNSNLPCDSEGTVNSNSETGDKFAHREIVDDFLPSEVADDENDEDVNHQATNIYEELEDAGVGNDTVSSPYSGDSSGSNNDNNNNNVNSSNSLDEVSAFCRNDNDDDDDDDESCEKQSLISECTLNSIEFVQTVNVAQCIEPVGAEGLYEGLSKNLSNKFRADDSTKTNRFNKRLERLRKELLCYGNENNFDQTTAQSPPLSPQPRTFETGDLVWGQMRGNPSWPGKLVSKKDVPGYNGQTDHGKVWVKWFGDNLVTQVELDKLKTLSEGLEAHHTARKKHRKGKKTDSCLDQAIQEAMMELDKQNDSSNLHQSSSSPSSNNSNISTKSHPPTTSSSLPQLLS